jgi:anti-anti-sigma regulatory factor/HAMP domain-containing protein
LTVLLVSVSVVAAGMTALLALVGGSNSLEDAAFDQLTTVREAKGDHIEDYFDQIHQQVERFSEDLMVVNAMKDLKTGFFAAEPAGGEERQQVDAELRTFYDVEFEPRLQQTTPDAVGLDFLPPSPTTRDRQHTFIAANQNPIGSKDQLIDPGDGSAYSQAHALYHPLLQRFQRSFGYYDLFLIDAETGHIVYSVFKEVDFGTSLDLGPHRGSGLADAFHAVRNARAVSGGADSDGSPLVDFRPYAPSYGAPASFIAAPIVEAGELIGVLAFQMPIDEINAIMTSNFEWETNGFGESGETYLVGDDLLLRSESRFLVEDKEGYLTALTEAGVDADTVNAIDAIGSAVGLQPVQTEGSSSALAGRTGTGTFPDYRNVSVLSSYRPVDIEGVNWAIMSEIDEDEAFESIASFRTQALIWLGIAALVIVVFAVWFGNRLVSPLRRLTIVASEIAGGNLDASVEVEGSDEIAVLARSFESMREAIVDLVQRQDRAIDALTTPLIPLRDGIVLLPLVGELDSRRMERLRSELVEGVHTRRAIVAIVDMTGVHTTADNREDTSAVKSLFAAFSSLRLLGASVVVTGLQADVAGLMSRTGLDADTIATETTLQLGLQRAANYLRRQAEDAHPMEEP